MQGNAGYTLIELLVVIAIMGLIAVFAAPSVTRTIAAATIDADARRTVAGLRTLQRVAEDGQRAVTISDGNAGISADANSQPGWPASSISLADAAHPIVYFADGTTTGGTLRLREEGRARDIDVAWLTGAVTIRDGGDAR